MIQNKQTNNNNKTRTRTTTTTTNLNNKLRKISHNNSYQSHTVAFFCKSQQKQQQQHQTSESNNNSSNNNNNKIKEKQLYLGHTNQRPHSDIQTEGQTEEKEGEKTMHNQSI